MQLSKNFWLSEFTKSQVATRLGLNNTPGPAELAALRLLVETVLQPVRDHFGSAVTISSGYRAAAVNRAVGGTGTSQHTKGQAADIEIPGVSNRELAQWIINNVPFDQVILEGYSPAEGPNSGWVHVSYRKNSPRRSILTAQFIGGRAHYSRGINA